MRLTLEPPPAFSFVSTLNSHGWCSLPPFRLVRDGTILRGAVARPGGGALAYSLSERGGRIAVDSPGRGDATTRRLLRGMARRVLNFDCDLGAFHEAVGSAKGLGWVARLGAGRLLRAPSAFEDLAKLVLTTNCTWAFTTRMVTSLVERYGPCAPDGSRAFPDAATIARVGTGGLARHCRVGYRAPFLAELARRVAAGRTDPESWQHDERDPLELRREMLALPGVGPYVAENMLRLIGRPAGLGLDSWLRAKYAQVYHGGRRVTDRTIARRYAGLGSWAGLALWCDMTRDWLEATDVADGTGSEWP